MGLSELNDKSSLIYGVQEHPSSFRNGDILISTDVFNRIDQGIAIFNVIRQEWRVNQEFSFAFDLPLTISETAIKSSWGLADNLHSTLEKALVHPFIHKNAVGIGFLVQGFALPDGNQVLICKDLREEEVSKSEIKAKFDQVTGIPSRVLGLSMLKEVVGEAAGTKIKLGIIVADIDGFKKLNNSLGHEAGDILLKETAIRLSLELKGKGIVSRSGDDEFLVVVQNEENSDIRELVGEISRSCAMPIEIMGEEIFPNLSFGVAVYPSDGIEVDELLRNAHIAFDLAKKEGMGGVRVFDGSMLGDVAAQLRMEAYLRHALENNELQVYYQPLVNNFNNKIIGAEALLRWNSPILGEISPDRFIPIAEKKGLILSIGSWVLRTACMEASSWKDETLSISVNVSGLQLKRGNFAREVETALHESGLQAKRLELEITESVLLDDCPEISRAIDKIKEYGVRFTLDDFGTGFSSIHYLRRYPFSTLKIDKSFIKELPINFSDANLVRSIIAMAKGLHLQVVGEGVENASQFKFLNLIGCNYSQGFLHSKAVPAEEFRRNFVDRVSL